MDYDKIPLKLHRAIYKVLDAIESNPAFVEEQITAHPEWATIPEPVKEGETLLHAVAARGSARLCKFLLKKGNDPNIVTAGAGYQTPLELAAAKGHLATCSWLLDHGARVDGSERSASTPLMVAAQEGHIELVRLLLERGAEVNRLHRNMAWTALDWAENYDQPRVAELLRNAGGVSAQPSEIDWSKAYGGSIIGHFHEHAGPVLPISLCPIVSGEHPVELRLCRIDGKDHFKLLFTVGLFAFRMIELYISLPAAWPITSSRIGTDPALAFPVKVLLELAARIASKAAVNEGFVLLRTDATGGGLTWPPGVEALVAVDQSWPDAEDDRDHEPEDEVTLLALVPLAHTKKGVPSGKALLDWIAKHRKSSWRKHALPLPPDA